MHGQAINGLLNSSCSGLPNRNSNAAGIEKWTLKSYRTVCAAYDCSLEWSAALVARRSTEFPRIWLHTNKSLVHEGSNDWVAIALSWINNCLHQCLWQKSLKPMKNSVAMVSMRICSLFVHNDGIWRHNSMSIVSFTRYCFRSIYSQNDHTERNCQQKKYQNKIKNWRCCLW